MSEIINYDQLLKDLLKTKIQVDEQRDSRSVEDINFQNKIQESIVSEVDLYNQQQRANDIQREILQYEEHLTAVMNENFEIQKAWEEITQEKNNLETQYQERLLSLIERLNSIEQCFNTLKDIQKPGYLKNETSSALAKSTALCGSLQRAKLILAKEQSKIDETQVNHPNYDLILNEKQVEEMSKKYGDLTRNEKKLADMEQNLRELQSQIQNRCDKAD